MVIKQLSSKNLIVLLLLAALLLAIHSYLANLLIGYQSVQFYQQQQTESQQEILVKAKENLSLSLAPLDTAQLTQDAQHIAGLEIVEAIKVYDVNGQQLYPQPDIIATTQQTTSPSKASELTVDGDIYGYLILNFINPTANQFQPQYWLYASALGVWLLLGIFLLSLKRSSSAKERDTKVGEQAATKNNPRQELQQLLKRNKKQKDITSAETLLIISANWELLSERSQLVSLLNRWTAHAKAFIIEFDSHFLKLGLTETANTQQLQQIQALELSLKQLKLKPTLLIHSLDFSEAIYQHFFQVVSTGIWTEHSLEEPETEEANNQVAKEIIEIDIEDIGMIELLKLPKIKAEQSLAIERQSRFYLQ